MPGADEFQDEVVELLGEAERLLDRGFFYYEHAVKFIEALRLVVNDYGQGCTCGDGGYHDDKEPRCRLNPTEGGDDAT